jgi:acetyl-CoA acetyltransferase
MLNAYVYDSARTAFARYAVVSLRIGVGQGIALVLERME